MCNKMHVKKHYNQSIKFLITFYFFKLEFLKIEFHMLDKINSLCEPLRKNFPV